LVERAYRGMTLKNEPVMTAVAAIELLKLFEQNQIEVTIDGGWGVDALLREQTRAHADLDIVIAYLDADHLRAVLEARGYKEIPLRDTHAYNFVMGDENGRLVDIHTYTFDPVGHPEYGIDYPLESLNGLGNILGYPVRCISLEYMVKFHTGYEVDETDYVDVKALCQRFDIEMPTVFGEFEK
jgi:lincosamide nucleotidyltransferase A/C/D/E